MSGWIGVDLDGTLAEYGTWKGPEHIGEPVPAMAFRVKKWLADGKDVRIFTARISGWRESKSAEDTTKYINDWTLKHFGQVIPVTCTKDFSMIELWDDRAIQVEPNTGRRIDGKA